VKRIRFLNFSQALGSGFYPGGAKNTSTESKIFKVPQTLRFKRTGRQRQKVVRLLSISDRLKVVAMRARCDDHLKPKIPGFLDVQHVSPVLDVGNGLVLGQYPTTSVWLDSAHGVNALMCGCSVGLGNAPYAKILSHVSFLTISTQ
jgi:hypothetical protein